MHSSPLLQVKNGLLFDGILKKSLKTLPSSERSVLFSPSVPLPIIVFQTQTERDVIKPNPMRAQKH